MTDESIIELPFSSKRFTGEVEHTELTDIDRAVGSFFQSVVQSLIVTDKARKENQEFARMTERPPNTKLYSGEFQSPQEFLMKLSAKVGKKVKQERNELLPTGYISRDPTVSFTDGSDYTDVTGFSVITNKNDKPLYRLNKSFVRLTYSLTFLAWNKSTLSRIALGVMMWSRHQKQGRPHVFKAKTMISELPVDIAIELTGMKDVMSEPAEIDHENTRLFASTMRFEVITEVYESESLEHVQGRMEIREGRHLE